MSKNHKKMNFWIDFCYFGDIFLAIFILVLSKDSFLIKKLNKINKKQLKFDLKIKK